MKSVVLVLFVFTVHFGIAQELRNNPGSNHGNKFEQLGTILPTPNEYRTASGAPGPAYWQQKADYTIKCELDEVNLRLTGSETISYFNNSPDQLTYLWFQLDENQHSNTKNANYQDHSTMPSVITDAFAQRMEQASKPNDFGINITKL